MTVTRYDRAPMTVRIDEDGYLHDEPIISRVGIFAYRRPDGSIQREYRPPEEVFHADSMASLSGKPVTNDHPASVNSTNVRKVAIGAVLSGARADGSDLRAPIVIHDPTPVSAEGKADLSCGYSCDFESIPGEVGGQRYDGVQRNIRYNHLAVVKRGRAGNARLNLDSADAVLDSGEPEMTTENAGGQLVRVRLDSGLSYEAAPEVEVAMNRLRQDTAQATADRDAATARADSAEAQVKDLQKQVEQARADGFTAARARLALEDSAKALGVEFKADATDRAIREGVVSKVRGDSLDLTGKSDAYVEAAYEMAVAEKGKRSDALDNQRREANAGSQEANGPRNDGTDDSAMSARDRMIAGLTKKEA